MRGTRRPLKKRGGLLPPPETAAAAALLGALCGALNGLLARFFLRRTLGGPQSLFLAVFAAGFFYRLLFLAAGVWLLRHEKYIIIISFAAALIITQLLFEVVPISGPWTSKKS